MTTDATVILIRKIKSQLSQNGVNALNFNSNLLSQIDAIVGTAANYAQVLSTAEGPIAQAAVAKTLGAIAADQAAGKLSAGAAAEASALAGAVATGIGAVIVLAISFILGAVSASNQPGSDMSLELEQIGQLLQDVSDEVLATYWLEKLGTIESFWSSPQGGLGTDLDNLANEGTGGTYVQNGVKNFHDHALAFVNNLIPSKTPLGLGEGYWERPVVPNQTFTTQTVPYWTVFGPSNSVCIGWYGNLPQPQPGPPLGGSASQMVLDPRTMLPFLLLGLQSYLMIQALVNLIDPSQPTFDTFIKQYQSDLQDYANFLLSQYKLAVNGIVKSDMPSLKDMYSFLYYEINIRFHMLVPVPWVPYLGGSEPILSDELESRVPTEGYSWNGVYGAIDTYPQYGTYQPSPPVAVPSVSLSYIIDIIDANFITDNLGNDFFKYEYIAESVLPDWTLPWLYNKLILGRMARWKAIYLINGYDRAWPIIQTLRVLANQPLLPPMTLDQDGTIATGDWSARELIKLLNVDGNILDGVEQGSLIRVPNNYSLFALVQVIDNIGNGNWGGPPSYSRSGKGPIRPLGFRDRLAKAAVSS